MWIIYDIRRIVQYLYQVFADMALWCWAHDPPFGSIGSFFAEIYDHLTDLHYGLYLFAEEYESLWDAIVGILTESDIFSLLQTWLNYAEVAWNWVTNAFDNVTGIIWEWWPIALDYVMTYVDNAVGEINTLIAGWNDFWTTTWPQWVSLFDDLKALWGNFWVNILPNLVSFSWLTTWWNSKLLDINALIDSWIQDLLPFLEGWQEIRDQVFEFFNDPWGWLYNRFDDFIERFW